MPHTSTQDMEKQIDEILYSFAKYCRHHERTGLSTGKTLNQYEAKQAIASLFQSREAELESKHSRDIVEARNAGLRRALKLLDGTGVWDTKTRNELISHIAAFQPQSNKEER